ncbi:MAG: alpha-1,2-fucosyltransferase [Lachnospiraceae bacterium]|nr:alpha-1,2-fucosyltransferase [Lachnospiraceae bacterium]
MGLKIQFLDGGLANQTFQYIFYRWLQLERPDDDVFMDDSYFALNTVHNGYELERVFGVKPRMISDCFEPDVWEQILDEKRNGKSIPQLFLDMNEEMSMVSETGNHVEFNPFNGHVLRAKAVNTYYPELAGFNGNWYYHGYWINKGYFLKYKDILSKELQFPMITDFKNKKYEDKILSTNSCSVHIRRGDFVDLNWSLPPEAFKQAIKKVLEAASNVTFFVFSDDLNWCKEHDEELGLNLTSRVVYVEGNTGLDSFRDLQLMSMCKWYFVSTSSFDYLGYILNKNLEYTVTLALAPGREV